MQRRGIALHYFPRRALITQLPMVVLRIELEDVARLIQKQLTSRPRTQVVVSGTWTKARQRQWS